MPVKTKATADEKLRIVQLCESGELSQGAAAKQLGVSQTSVYQWVCQYRERGPSCFNALKRNQSYSPELKFQAVQAYLTGQGSLQVIASRYGLRSKSQLQRWIRMYNEGRNFGQGRSGGSRMTTSRKITREERVAIVKDCLEISTSVLPKTRTTQPASPKILKIRRKFNRLCRSLKPIKKLSTMQFILLNIWKKIVETAEPSKITLNAHAFSAKISWHWKRNLGKN